MFHPSARISPCRTLEAYPFRPGTLNLIHCYFGVTNIMQVSGRSVSSMRLTGCAFHFFHSEIFLFNCVHGACLIEFLCSGSFIYCLQSCALPRYGCRKEKGARFSASPIIRRTWPINPYPSSVHFVQHQVPDIFVKIAIINMIKNPAGYRLQWLYSSQGTNFSIHIVLPVYCS